MRASIRDASYLGQLSLHTLCMDVPSISFWTFAYRTMFLLLLFGIMFVTFDAGDSANAAHHTAQRAADESTEAVAAAERLSRRVDQLKASIDDLSVAVKDLNAIVTETAVARQQPAK